MPEAVLSVQSGLTQHLNIHKSMCVMYTSVHTHIHTHTSIYTERGREKVNWIEPREDLEFGLLSICLKGREAWKKGSYVL